MYVKMIIEFRFKDSFSSFAILTEEGNLYVKKRRYTEGKDIYILDIYEGILNQTIEVIKKDNLEIPESFHLNSGNISQKFILSLARKREVSLELIEDRKYLIQEGIYLRILENEYRHSIESKERELKYLMEEIKTLSLQKGIIEEKDRSWKRIVGNYFTDDNYDYSLEKRIAFSEEFEEHLLNKK